MERRSWVAGLVAGALFATPVAGAAGWWAIGRLGPDPGEVRRRYGADWTHVVINDANGTELYRRPIPAAA